MLPMEGIACIDNTIWIIKFPANKPGPRFQTCHRLFATPGTMYIYRITQKLGAYNHMAPSFTF